MVIDGMEWVGWEYGALKGMRCGSLQYNLSKQLSISL